jgi:hypothetical protein
VSVAIQPSAAPVKPPRWNFAGVCICCGHVGCAERSCAAWHAASTWMVCPLCDGVQQLPDDTTCWICLFGVIEAE